MSRKVLCIVGTGPNLIKAGPLMRELRQYPDAFATKLVHTGQHYDRNLSQLLFEDLGMAEPEINLGVGSGSHAEQTGRVMVALESTMLEEKPTSWWCLATSIQRWPEQSWPRSSV